MKSNPTKLKPVLWLSIIAAKELKYIFLFFMKGLLGNFDGNSTNDFKAPNGDITPSNSVESVIYTFGKKCKFIFVVC